MTGTGERAGVLGGAPVHFFFYGTLMEGGGSLRSVAPRRIGLELVDDEAKVSGLLYAVGAAFPALVAGRADGNWRQRPGVVTGQLWRADPTTAALAFEAFDAIEGYRPDVDRGMYLRREVELLEPAGTRAFTYFWNGSMSYLSRIWSGDWRRWLTEPSESLADGRGAGEGRTIISTGHRLR